MNAMQQAFINSVPMSTEFPKFTGAVKPVEVKPLSHVIIPVRSNGEGSIIKGKKVTRLVTEVIQRQDDGVLLRDDQGELWRAEQVSHNVYKARS